VKKRKAPGGGRWHNAPGRVIASALRRQLVPLGPSTPTQAERTMTRRIIIIGAGFGGLYAAQAIERALMGRRRVHVTLITDQDHFLFSPLLPNVANGELTLRSITLPLREQLDPSTELLLDRVTELEIAQRRLRTESGRVLPFDYLLLAPGATIGWSQAQQHWRPHTLTCKDAGDAVRIREAIEGALTRAASLSGEARQRALTFVFAGGGPTGVELLAELRAGMEHTFAGLLTPETRRALRMVLVEPRDELLTDLPPKLRQIARRHLEAQGVEIRLGARVIGRDATSVALDDGDTLLADLFFWCAGVQPSPLCATDGFLRDARGRVRVNEHLEALGHEGIFVIGDAADTPNDDAQTAQVATQQAPVAAANIVAAMSGRTPRVWRYEHKGDLITLGRPNAAVHIRGVSMEGPLAYGLYRLAYASLIPTALKKAQLLGEWLEHDLQTRPKPVAKLDE
jgi:NADH dehydrogenase